ncbi:BatA domain-containing protein [Roseomonas mucosa]|uniref:BatA domain-containing protein n=1 Tax=Roseomonas mucosa TaxID=207340 RepID=UPI0030CBAB39
MNLGPLLFAAPWLLLALPALPLLWWLLRVTPPSPKRQSFPPTRLLRDLPVAEETPARTPWWLLLLRLAAAALIVLGLARPVWDATAGAGGQGPGPLLLAIDNGWASAADWPQRMATARAAVEAAGRDGRPVSLLATAPAPDGQMPAPTPPPCRRRRPRPASPRCGRCPGRRTAPPPPRPWPPGGRRMAGAASLFITDGLTHASGDSVLATTLAEMGPLTVAGRDPALPLRILPPPVAEADRLRLTVRQTPSATPGEAAVLARTADGRTLARATIAIPAGAGSAEGALELPLEIREQVVRLELEGETGAAGSVLLDERFRRRPVGLLAGDGAADTPLTGSLFYLERALQPFVEVRRGSLETLLSRKLAVLVLADYPLTEAREIQAVTRFVEEGGLLLRFAGPRMAEHPDPLLPVTLRAGERQLGGSLSWEKPQPLATTFPDTSPFAGLAVPPEVAIRTQVLAEPAPRLSERTWATLADGTPLVTGLGRGAGRIVLVHVTANADWSDLPLSGLFVDMLRRLVALSSGVAEAAGAARLAPIESMDGFGHLGPAPATATAIVARDLAATVPGPAHPPGWYGTPGESGERRALNLSAHVPAPVLAPPPPAGARAVVLGGVPVERDLGPWLLAAAMLLLLADLVLSLVQRGLLGRGGGAGAAGLSRRVAPRRVAMLALLLPLGFAAPPRPKGRPRPRRGTAGPCPPRMPRPLPHASPMWSPAMRRWTRSRAPGWRGCRTM